MDALLQINTGPRYGLYLGILVRVLLLLFLIYRVMCKTNPSVKEVELYGETVSICLPSSSCDGRCGSPLDNTTTCSCDAVCSVFRDCCYDFSDKCEGQNKTIIQNDTTYVKETACFKSDPDNSDMGYHVISTCLGKSTNETVMLKCEQPDSSSIIQQILVSDYRGNIYRNIYCAACDGINTVDLVPWHVVASCNSSDIERHLTNVSSAGNQQMLYEKLGKGISCSSYKYTPPENSKKPPRLCHSSQKETCPEALVYEEQVRIGCNAYSATVYVADTKRAYKNPHCAICNAYSLYNCEKPVTTTENPRENLKIAILTILVDFAEGEISLRTEKSVHTGSVDCGIGKVFDYIMEKCKNLQCDVGYTLSGSTCVVKSQDAMKLPPRECNRKPPLISNRTFCLCQSNMQRVTLTHLTNDNSSTLENLIYHVINNTVKTNFTLSNLTIENLPDDSGTFYSVAFVTSECQDAAFLSSVVSNWVYADNKLTSSLSPITFVHSCWSIVNTISKNKSCATETIFANQINVSNLNGTRILKNKNESIYVPDYDYTIRVTYTIKNDSTVCATVSLVTCEDISKRSCPLIELNLDSFVKKKNNNTTLEHATTGKMFPVGEYSLTANGSVLVCSFFNQTVVPNVMVIFVYHGTIQIVNLIGVILSLIGLFFTFSIRCVFQELRTNSGKIIMNFSLALFIAQLLTLLQGHFIGDSKACTAVAAILHYIWLVAFLWMNSMAIDLFRIFRALKVSTRNEYWNHIYRRYIIYSWCTPAVFVCILLGVQAIDFPAFKFKYSDESVCWIREEFSSLLVFGLPIALVIIVNFVFFIFTILGIRKAKRSTTRVQSESKINMISEELIIYIRISTTMGLTWLFGFLAPFVDRIEIWYIFIILNTSQGFLIFIAYNINRNMREIFVNKYFANKTTSHNAKQNQQASIM